MGKIETRILWWMFTIALFSLILIGATSGFWPALAYACALGLLCRAYWLLVATRPRMICVPVHTFAGVYMYREVARG